MDQLNTLAEAVVDSQESRAKWWKWRSMRFTGGNRKKFVRKFVQASRECAETTGSLNRKDEIYQFMSAVAGHEGRFLLCLWVLVDPDAPLAIQTLYRLFEEEEDIYRRFLPGMAIESPAPLE